jgi:DNA-binding MarR family transcriptional regulator
MPSSQRDGGTTFFKFVLLVNLVARPFGRLHERTNDLKLPEWRVLRALYFAPGPITAGVLGEVLGMDKMAVSRAVRALELRGRLHRGPDPADGRRIALTITAEGRDLVARIEPSGRAREAALLATLSEAERALLDGLLDRLVAQARSLPDPTTDQNP